MNSIVAVRQAVDGRQTDRLNTIAVFVSPREFLATECETRTTARWTAATSSIHYWRDRLEWWDGFLSQVNILVDAGVVQYVALTEIAETFVEQEANLDSDFGEIPGSDASMRMRNLKAGYPLGQVAQALRADPREVW